MKLPARIFGILLFLILIGHSLIPLANAQSADLNTLMQTDSSVPTTVSTLTQGVFFGLLSTATCVVGGVDYFSPTHKCLAYNPQKGQFSYATSVGGGLLALQGQAISMLFTSPFHTSDYIHYMASNFGLVKKADAASGFDQLNPVATLWIAFRNIAYLFFVILFIIVGFAIMIRAKIDPRTVMTIENQLPKLIVALILISFSFAIAGLAIDLMWVFVYFIINLFGSLDPQIGTQVKFLSAGIYGNPYIWLSNLNNGFGGFLGIAGQAAGGVKDITNNIAFGIFQTQGWLKVLIGTIYSWPIVISCAVTQWFHISIGPLQVGNDFWGCFDAGWATIVSSLIGGITFLIFAFALLGALFKLWWALLKSFALFHVYVILGPVMIMMGVLPESKINFEDWLRHIIAYLAVYPTAIAIFLLGKTLMDVYTRSNGFTPPLIGANPAYSGFLGPLLGFAVIMLAPSTVNMVQEALKAPDFKFLPQIGAGIAAGGSIVTGGWSKAVMDPLFREADPVRQIQGGIIREWAQGRMNGRIGRYFGLARQATGGQGPRS